MSDPFFPADSVGMYLEQCAKEQNTILAEFEYPASKHCVGHPVFNSHNDVNFEPDLYV